MERARRTVAADRGRRLGRLAPDFLLTASLIAAAEVAASDPLPRVSSRVVLRRLRLADLDNFQAYRSDPDVGRYQGWSPMSADAARAFIDGMSIAAFGATDKWLQIAIAHPASDRLIGDMGICVRHNGDLHAEIGYSVAAAAQGQGVGSAAVREAMAMLFEHTDIARVAAITDARNEASVRLLRRIGLTLDETVNTVFRGEPCVELVFSMARDAWSSRRA